jgi:hypothetical protein
MFGEVYWGQILYGEKRIRWDVGRLGNFAMTLWGYVNKISNFPIQLGIITLSKIKAVLKITKERVRAKYKFL